MNLVDPHVFSLVDLMLMQQANRYKLTEDSERQRSTNELVSLFCRLQDAVKPDVTLEIGAFEANFSARMAGLGFRAYAFEANPYNHAEFAPALSGIANLDYVHSAVGDIDGEVDFYVQKIIRGREVSPVRGNNSLLERTDRPGRIKYDIIRVPCMTFVTLMQRHDFEGKPYSMWIDIEGALGKFIAGCGTALAGCLSLLVEVEQYESWKGQTLYRDALPFFMSQGLVPVARDFEYENQYNILLLRAELLELPSVRQMLADYFSSADRPALAFERPPD